MTQPPKPFRYRPLCDPSSAEADGSTSPWLLDFALHHNGMAFRMPPPMERTVFDLYNRVLLPRWTAEVEQRVPPTGQPQPLHLTRADLDVALIALGHADDDALRPNLNRALLHLQHAQYLLVTVTQRHRVVTGAPYPYATFEPWDGYANPQQLSKEGAQVVKDADYVRLVAGTWPEMCEAMALLEYR